ncbi:carbohydrate ABC transporter permease [Lacrimispora aerotolerans]|uniref:carbohydrate ABC transporter permease n=1 Tax=Lacrimispora aerotolerans TaxID=36832 RepID=UPI00047D15D3|nr:carbohydrate ABC transporter permease [Lacrimispora aerotolerans]
MMAKRRLVSLGKHISAILFMVFMLLPFFLVLVNSLKPRIDIIKNPLALPQALSLANYAKAWTTMKFGHVLMNTVYITAFSQIFLISFGAMLSYLLVRWNWKINKYIFTLLICAMIIPFQSLMIPFVSIFGKLGLMNSRTALIFFYMGFGMPMTTFMYHGFMKGISKEMEEAALIDGCSHFYCFWKIVFPNLKPITTTILIVNILWIWNDFLLPSLVLIKDKNRTIPLSTFYFFGEYTAELGLAMAALILSVLPVVVIYLFLQKQIVTGVMDGAIK